MMHPCFLSLVIPVFNEEEALAHTCARLGEVAERLKTNGLVSRVEFVFVNDGSRDQSERALEAAKPALTNATTTVEVLHFSRNFGHSAAVFAGLNRASGEIIGIIDADLQDPPELLGDMLEAMRATDADVVYGQRRARAGETLFKRLTAWAFYRAIGALSGVDIPRDTGDFRIMTREVTDQVRALEEREPFLRGLVAWIGFKQVAFPYDRQARAYGVTKYPLRKMFAFAGNAIMSFSLFPLRLATYLGLVGIALSATLAGYAIFRYVNGQVVPGWASLVLSFAFGQSITLFLIGIVGYYIGQIHLSQQRRPRYILRAARAGGPRA